MIMYAWDVFPAGAGCIPLAAGVHGEAARAREVAAAALIGDPGASLARIEAVRPALGWTAQYERTGRAWLGTRAPGGGVSWREGGPAR